MKTKCFLIYLFIVLTANTVFSSENIIIGGIDGLDPHSNENEHKILLALSGGGARGLTIIGFLKAFEEKNIEIVGIAGTSMGGIIGGLYAAGDSPEEIDKFADKLKFNKLFSNSPPRNSMFLTKRETNEKHLLSIRFNKYKPVFPKALTSGQELSTQLTDLTTKANYKCGADFSKLPIPYLSISTDIVSGEQVVVTKGSIAEAMRSTMAFPLAFTGVEVGDRILMDGGMVTPLPVELARTLSSKSQFVVAINTTSKLLKKDEILNPIDIANQVTTIMTADKLLEQLSKADYILDPPIDSYLSSQFHKKDSLVEIGYRYGLEKADDIKATLQKQKLIASYNISNIESTSILEEEVSYLLSTFLDKRISSAELISMLKQFVLKNNYFKIEVSVVENISDSLSVAQKTLIINGYKNFKANKVKLLFEGNTLVPDIELAKLFQITQSDITPKTINDGLDRIIDLYHSQNFDLVTIRQIDIDPENSTILIDIDEAIVSTINIADNKMTKDWFIRSYFPLKKGDPYSTFRASEGIRNIYGTDLFERATVEAIPSKNGVIVLIRVKEKHSARLQFGWHWDDEYDSEEFFELLNDNFLGIGLEYKLHARYSPKRQNYYFSFRADRIFKTYLTSQFKFSFTDLERIKYNEDDLAVGFRNEKTSGFKLSIGQQIARLGTVSVNLAVEEIEIFDSELNISTKFGLRKLIFESLFENFNKLPFPHSGNRHIFSLEFAGKFIGGDVEFTKFFTSHESYIPLGKQFTYHPYLALGASRSGLPVSEQFYLGGIDSFTGFHSEQLSGDKMFILSNELRIKLPFNLYLTTRYDLGEVYTSIDQIKLRNLRNAVGASLSLDSPIGPFTFGYGIVNNNQEEVYLHIGFKF